MGGEGSNHLLVLRIEGNDRAGLVERVQELEDADVAAGQLVHRDRQHRARRVVAGGIEPPVERPRLVHADRVRVGHVDDLARLRDVPGEARLGQPKRLGLQSLQHRGRAQLALQEVVLDDGEPEVITLAKEQGAGLGPREPPGGHQHSLEQRVEVALGGERESDLEKLLQELFAIGHRLRAH